MTTEINKPARPVTAFDRQQVIDLARDELAGWPIGSGYYGTKLDVDEAREMAEAALPVIVAVVLKPIRELHAAGEPVCVETGHTPITTRQGKVLAPEANIELPGFSPPGFHTRRKCRSGLAAYDQKRRRHLGAQWAPLVSDQPSLN